VQDIAMPQAVKHWLSFVHHPKILSCVLGLTNFFGWQAMRRNIGIL